MSGYGLNKEWLRLGDASARKAERELQMRGARSKVDAPIKDLEDGAFGFQAVNFGFLAYDDVSDPQTTEGSADRIMLRGYNVLRGVDVSTSEAAPQLCYIYLTDSRGVSMGVVSGEASLGHPLSWSGEKWLQGDYYVDAWIAPPADTAEGSWLHVLAQRIQRGMEVG